MRYVSIRARCFNITVVIYFSMHWRLQDFQGGATEWSARVRGKKRNKNKEPFVRITICFSERSCRRWTRFSGGALLPISPTLPKALGLCQFLGNHMMIFGTSEMKGCNFLLKAMNDFDFRITFWIISTTHAPHCTSLFYVISFHVTVMKGIHGWIQNFTKEGGG